MPGANPHNPHSLPPVYVPPSGLGYATPFIYETSRSSWAHSGCRYLAIYIITTILCHNHPKMNDIDLFLYIQESCLKLHCLRP